MRPEISVVIPVFNSRQLLERCLCSLDQQSIGREEFEVIVVDDGSSDGSSDVARKWGARVFRQEKKGAAAARNRGIQEAKGKVLVFLDADCEADRGWLSKIVEAINQDSIGGAVGRFTSDQENWVARLIQLEIEGRHKRMKHFDRIDFVNTATCGFKREVLQDKGFDESFQKLEDIELSFRLAQDSTRVAYVPDATVKHFHPESLWAYVRRKFRYARMAPVLYRRFPKKVLSDSSTPQYRRLQLLLLAAAVPGVAIKPIIGLILAAGSVAFSSPLIVRALRQSVPLGLLAPFFVLSGNLGFVAGALWGLSERFLPRR